MIIPCHTPPFFIHIDLSHRRSPSLLTSLSVHRACGTRKLPMRGTLPILRRFPRASGGLARKGNASLHPKFGNRLWYKGNRARSLGRHTTKSAYHVDYDQKVPQYVVPGSAGILAREERGHPQPPQLPEDCVVGGPGWDHGLKPYVSARTPKVVVPPPPMPDGWEKVKHLLKDVA